MEKKNRNMRPTWGPVMMILVIIFFLTPLVNAGTWRDEFEDEDFDGWTLRNSHSIWFVFDDALWARVRAPGLPAGINDFLEFIASPGPYDQFTVTLTNPSFSMSIGLGKLFPETGSPDIFFYKFSPTHLGGVQVPPSGGGPVSGFRGWLPGSPGTLWEEKPVKVTVRFDAGRFQYVADGELRAEFEDPHFDRIEFITVIISGVDGGQGQVDAFEISGPGIGGLSVRPKGKLATTWGSIKKR